MKSFNWKIDGAYFCVCNATDSEAVQYQRTEAIIKCNWNSAEKSQWKMHVRDKEKIVAMKAKNAMSKTLSPLLFRLYTENKYDLKQFATMNEATEDVHAESQQSTEISFARSTACRIRGHYIREHSKIISKLAIYSEHLCNVIFMKKKFNSIFSTLAPSLLIVRLLESGAFCSCDRNPNQAK